MGVCNLIPCFRPGGAIGICLSGLDVFHCTEPSDDSFFLIFCLSRSKVATYSREATCVASSCFFEAWEYCWVAFDLCDDVASCLPHYYFYVKENLQARKSHGSLLPGCLHDCGRLDSLQFNLDLFSLPFELHASEQLEVLPQVCDCMCRLSSRIIYHILHGRDVLITHRPSSYFLSFLCWVCWYSRSMACALNPGLLVFAFALPRNAQGMSI